MLISKKVMEDLKLKVGLLVDDIMSNSYKYSDCYLVIDRGSLKLKSSSVLKISDEVVLGLDLSVDLKDEIVDNAVEKLRNNYVYTILSKLIAM